MFFIRRKTPRQKYLEEVAKKHGYELVPYSRVYPHFEEVSSVLTQGYESLGTGLYGKQINKDIVHLLKVYFVKGGACILRWGVSLSFVPHKWEKELKWHRTLKSSHFDLCEFTNQYFHTDDWRKNEDLSASILNGEVYLHESLTTLWGRVSTGIEEWFYTVSHIEGVMDKAMEQMTRDTTGIRILPYPELVYAFCLARLDRVTEAQLALNNYIAKTKEKPKSVTNLQRAIEMVVQD